LAGGSGGYIYVHTQNSLDKNFFSEQFSIEAKGGYGTNGFYGGSGGVIVFDGDFRPPERNIKAAGGTAYDSLLNLDGCGNGAAGTILYRRDGRLIISNQDILTK